MPQVICTLQNMSGSVSGVTFTREPDSDGPWLSEVISEDLTDSFASIPGYQRVIDPTEPPLPDLAPVAAPPTRKGKP